jgi:hypothetical protein
MKICPDCGQPFEPRLHYAVRCYPCQKEYWRKAAKDKWDHDQLVGTPKQNYDETHKKCAICEHSYRACTCRCKCGLPRYRPDPRWEGEYIHHAFAGCKSKEVEIV